ncbi:MAG: tyrosine-type recombinase/integrase [Candidatus Gastranaerophilales bacterium]|nr:tyrosine-type recombinase/integrase [Candidatus Gastranaerophilales bacterium]
MSVYKKNGKYYCRFQLNGERHHYLCSGAASLTEAKKLESQFMYKVQQQQNGVIPKELKNITINSLFIMYLKYSKTNKKSFKTDVSRVKLIKQYFGETTLIRDIQPNKIERFKDFLLEEGRSKATVNRYLEQIKTAFKIAVDNEYILKNPCKNIKKFPLKNYTVRYLTEDEESRLFKTLPDYLKNIVITALNTGLRKSNILNLKWEQIDFEFQFLEVLENKGNKHIKLPLNNTLLKLFEEMYKNKSSEYVFINPKTSLPYTDIKKAWTTALKEAKIENFRFHDLRHTVGTRLAKENVPINIIKEILAHSDIKTTMRYVHCTQGAKTEALSKLNSYH